LFKNLERRTTTTTSDFVIYPNPSNGNFTIGNTNQTYLIEVRMTYRSKDFMERTKTTEPTLSLLEATKGNVFCKNNN
jgi:hypothetical protein